MLLVVVGEGVQIDDVQRDLARRGRPAEFFHVQRLAAREEVGRRAVQQVVELAAQLLALALADEGVGVVDAVLVRPGRRPPPRRPGSGLGRWPSAVRRLRTCRMKVCCESVSPPALARPTRLAATVASMPFQFLGPPRRDRPRPTSSAALGQANRTQTDADAVRRAGREDARLDVRREARMALAFVVVEPGRVARAEELHQIALRIDRQDRHALKNRLLDQYLGQPGLAAAGRADDGDVRRQRLTRQADRADRDGRRPWCGRAEVGRPVRLTGRAAGAYAPGRG